MSTLKTLQKIWGLMPRGTKSRVHELIGEGRAHTLDVVAGRQPLRNPEEKQKQVIKACVKVLRKINDKHAKDLQRVETLAAKHIEVNS